MNARTQHLYNAAKNALEEAGFEFNTQSVGVTISLAAMLDAAFPAQAAPVKRAVKGTERLTMPFTPTQLFDTLEAGCGERLNLRPYDGSTFAMLARKLAKCGSLTAEDPTTLVAWINAGNLDFWESKPTWNHVCKHVTNWIAQARAWEAKGGHASGSELLGADDWR